MPTLTLAPVCYKIDKEIHPTHSCEIRTCSHAVSHVREPTIRYSLPCQDGDRSKQPPDFFSSTFLVFAHEEPTHGDPIPLQYGPPRSVWYCGNCGDGPHSIMVATVCSSCGHTKDGCCTDSTI
ncbi:hypothetical protein P171DRAFT_429525 [Karstenula rhodostoma CBS 690.94]|uniref:Uncharacterized protein n=1 Tax=Karstenula rhodostoma CBS 690.94 TaxID=1392251 RepID=A0A9P4PPC7_9PLEO|nr:hypothetical protein P171DRAFT_429525 [Karstenula rhodostoma CBS 690.94]